MRVHEIRIADEIAKQMGAARGGMRQIAAFTGAKNFRAMRDDGNIRGGLAFMFPRTKNSNSEIGTVNRVQITLEANDTYTVEFGYTHGGKYSEKFKMAGVYGDMRRDLWWNHTGLALSF